MAFQAKAVAVAGDRRRRWRHPQCYSYWSNVIVHRAGLIKTNCHRPDHLSQDSLSEPQRLRLSKEVVRHKLVQPRTILVIFVIYRITLSYEDQQVLGTLAHYDGREGMYEAASMRGRTASRGHSLQQPRVVSLSHIILSRLGAHILTGTLLDRHARRTALGRAELYKSLEL